MNELESEYRARYKDVLQPLAERLESTLRSHLNGVARIDRICTRAKSIDRFIGKASKQKETGEPKYSDPLNQIQDQIGARIVTFYLKDVEAIASTVENYFRLIEKKNIVPEKEKEFGYTGKHYILFLPSDIFYGGITPEMAPRFFELQIKTLFQHAWSEAEHDLNYKADCPLTFEQKRRIAFTAAQAWGADHHFDELHTETDN